MFSSFSVVKPNWTTDCEELRSECCYCHGAAPTRTQLCLPACRRALLRACLRLDFKPVCTATHPRQQRRGPAVAVRRWRFARSVTVTSSDPASHHPPCPCPCPSSMTKSASASLLDQEEGRRPQTTLALLFFLLHRGKVAPIQLSPSPAPA